MGQLRASREQLCFLSMPMEGGGGHRGRRTFVQSVINFALTANKIAEDMYLISTAVRKVMLFFCYSLWKFWDMSSICLDHELSTMTEWSCAHCLNTMKPGGKSRTREDPKVPGIVKKKMSL